MSKVTYVGHQHRVAARPDERQRLPRTIFNTVTSGPGKAGFSMRRASKAGWLYMLAVVTVR